MSLVGIRECPQELASRPILFSGAMVRALLEGKKTQTRRVLKLPTKTFSGGPIYERPDMGGWEATTSGGGGCFTIGKAGERIPAPEQVAIWHRTTGVCLSIPTQPGDRLWVREGYSGPYSMGDIPPRDWRHDLPIWYWADGNPDDGDWTKPKPGIHMPRWASRLTLTVADVRVRLQDIREEDARAEGGEATTFWREEHPPSVCFSVLWNSINGPESWASNPWVAAYSFTVEHRNIDEGRACLADATPKSPSPQASR